MKEFPVVSTGTSAKTGMKWAMIAGANSENPVVADVAFVTLMPDAKIKTGDTIQLPESKVALLEWK
jgi:hypothetical protein